MDDEKDIINTDTLMKVWDQVDDSIKSEAVEVKKETKGDIEKEEVISGELKKVPDDAEKEESAKEDKSVKETKPEYESLKKQLSESKSWGHKKNIELINAKKKMTDFLARLEENGNIYEDDVKEALGFFSAVDDKRSEVPEEVHPYVTLKQNLDKEFSVYKKYSKVSDAEEKYNAYFSFLPLHSREEQEKILTYLSEESTEKALEHIMDTGTELYEDLYKELDEKGGILPYVKSLKSKITKLDKKNKELTEQLDETKGTVYSRSINSKVYNPQPKITTIEQAWGR